MASILSVAGVLFILTGKKLTRIQVPRILVLFVIFLLMILRGKSYYTIGLFPFLFAAGAVFFDISLKSGWSRFILPVILVLLTIPILPMGLPVYKSVGLVNYFNHLEKRYGIVIGRRFEDNSIHSLPQDYADMLGWEQLARVADNACSMIYDKRAAFIYCENYGQAGAITVIGKKYKLPEAVCFSESFRYWIPIKFDPDPTAVIYINNKPGKDVNELFSKVTDVGSISNPDAREFGTTVYLCRIL